MCIRDSLRLLGEMGVEATCPVIWTLPHCGAIDIRESGALSCFRDLAIQTVWAELAGQRQGFAGLRAGFDRDATLAYPQTFRGERHWRMRTILADGVWTPCRRGRVNAGPDKCIHCPQAQADIHHMWWACPGIPRPLWNDHGGFPKVLRFCALHAGQPECLWRTGLVPKGFVPRDLSPLFWRRLDFHPLASHH